MQLHFHSLVFACTCLQALDCLTCVKHHQAIESIGRQMQLCMKVLSLAGSVSSQLYYTHSAGSYSLLLLVGLWCPSLHLLQTQAANASEFRYRLSHGSIHSLRSKQHPWDLLPESPTRSGETQQTDGTHECVLKLQ